MARSTFLVLTNKLLRRLNEVELTETNFLSERGIHALARDSIIDAVNDINHKEHEWPFNFTSTSFDLDIGVETYDFPEDFKAMDWESFYIAEDDALRVGTYKLTLINKDDWFKHYRPDDVNAGSVGVSTPKYVAPYGEGFVITPSPNDEYNLNYSYWREPRIMENWDDEPTIPEEWDYVIVAGAMWHMNMFKENANGVNLIEQHYRQCLRNMRTILINRPEAIRDTRVRH